MDFEIKITRDREEIREAQRLRFEVFNLEMKKGLKASHERGLDVDDFDPICDHLIVREPEQRQIVGTYRLLRGSVARSHSGFYSETEFDLAKIKNLDGELLELGRSCARKDYRDKSLIRCMWQRIAEYVNSHRVRYLFGCASLDTTDPGEVSQFYALLKEKYYAPEGWRVLPRPENAFVELDDQVKIKNKRALFFRLPSLVKGYLRIGALLCGPPALDREFGTSDLFLLLDFNRASSEYLGRFGLSVAKSHDAVG